MDLTVQTADLNGEIRWLSKMTNEMRHPSAGYIEVSGLVGALALRRTNGEQFYQTVIPGAGGGQAEVVVDASKLAQGLSRAAGEVILTIAEDGLTIESNRQTVRIKGEKVTFPAWPVFQFDDSKPVGRVSSVQFNRVLASLPVSAFAPVLTNVLFDEGNMVTTDTKRMTRVKYADEGFTALLPATAIRAFATGGTLVNITLGQTMAEPPVKMARLQSGGRSILATLNTGEFPNWRGTMGTCIPKGKLLVGAPDLLSAVTGKESELTFKQDAIIVRSKNDGDDGMEFEQKVDVKALIQKWEGEPKVKFRSNFLSDALRALASGALVITISDENRPTMFADVGDQCAHIVMPLRAEKERKTESE